MLLTIQSFPWECKQCPFNCAFRSRRESNHVTVYSLLDLANSISVRIVCFCVLGMRMTNTSLETRYLSAFMERAHNPNRNWVIALEMRDLSRPHNPTGNSVTAKCAVFLIITNHRHLNHRMLNL